MWKHLKNSSLIRPSYSGCTLNKLAKSIEHLVENVKVINSNL